MTVTIIFLFFTFSTDETPFLLSAHSVHLDNLLRTKVHFRAQQCSLLVTCAKTSAHNTSELVNSQVLQAHHLFVVQSAQYLIARQSSLCHNSG